MPPPKRALIFFLSLIVLGLAGCETRSISNSGYQRGWRSAENPLYKGELTEFDVLGVAPPHEATDENIRNTLNAAHGLKLKRGDALLLVQSGALVPDSAMLDASRGAFEIAPFSGVPPRDHQGFAQSLRLRAAQGGYPYVLCYWGVLESSRRNAETSAISWVPIVGGFIPDEKQEMRIRLKALLVDVRSGHWRMYAPESYADSKWTSGMTRVKADQTLVERLKASGYRALVSDLLK